MDTRRTGGPYPGHMSTASPRPENPAAALVFDDPLSVRSADDTDRGWGEGASGKGDGASGAGGDAGADLARFLDEKPPHHL